MQLISNIWNLIKKDVNIELRQGYVFASILLYVISTVFIISRMLQTVSPMLWNTMFWIIFLFTALSTLMKSFQGEISSRENYYYYLVGPVEIIVAKFIYNFVNLFILSLLLLLSFTIFINNPVSEFSWFITSLCLGSLGLSVVFTLVSSIAYKGGNNATLMSILSIPLTLPIILIVLKLSAAGIGILSATDLLKDIYLLLAIIVILIGVSLLLFSQIWRT